ncbi:MAG: 2-hydroxyacyl-CoA dehydratase, partial [Opitutales bacterium]|nr:2-hydroxyacyl-CoA dehydratase [Opitutales bacterium]
GAFAKALNADPSKMVLPQFSETFAAMGAAFSAQDGEALPLSKIVEKIGGHSAENGRGALPPLFESEVDFEKWKRALNVKELETRQIENGEALEVFIGIDSGSTTAKLAVIDPAARLVFCRYAQNSGRPLERIAEFLDEFFAFAKSKNAEVKILASAATGYGEDLARAAFNMDFGIVETMAHLQAAQWVDKDVSFVLDIGGQDMKSIFVENGAVKNIELNESCSSGCGSFLQGFAAMMNLSLEEFSRAACLAKKPCDLGTRCTVFMNSKVKEALRSQSEIADIAAGLAVSVVKNCLFKVLKISNMERLGGSIVVQGGTFKNMAVLRALETLSGKKISMCDRPEIMGAMGAALYARSLYSGGISTMQKSLDFSKISRENLNCKGCANRCAVVKFSFENGNTSYAGNKCERFFHSRAKSARRGEDGLALRCKTIFSSPALPAQNLPKIGIPRVLNIYENYPFWRELFEKCGFEPVLSGLSNTALASEGAKFLMSENLCFPAKLAHGHVLDLIKKGCRRIFFPMVVKEHAEGKNASNSFNCPVVAGYPNVVKNSMDIARKFSAEFDYPAISFESEEALRRGCFDYFKTLGVEKSRFDAAFKSAVCAMNLARREICNAQKQILERAKKSGNIALVFTGRPYHSDPLVNQKASQIAADLGADVVADDAFLFDEIPEIFGANYISQWTYPNRVVRAACAVARLPQNIALVQLNSFGCGPDSFLMDEASEILKAAGKNLTVVRIDEISSPGSIRLRLRSLIESMRSAKENSDNKPRGEYVGYNLSYDAEDRKKTIVVPFFDEIISPLVPAMGEATGYKIEVLPPPDEESVAEGLKYAHNEVCYPATIVAGDIVKFLKTRKNPSDYVVAITQTGGQCRATNYLALIKNAMRLAGFGNVKILSVNYGQAFKNSQPGFKLGLLKSVKISMMCLLFTDAISEMHSAVRAREKRAGEALKTASEYVKRAGKFVKELDFEGLFGLLEEAVEAFNSIETEQKDVKKVGFIGEIYLKHNAFSN